MQLQSEPAETRKSAPHAPVLPRRAAIANAAASLGLAPYPAMQLVTFGGSIPHAWEGCIEPTVRSTTVLFGHLENRKVPVGRIS